MLGNTTPLHNNGKKSKNYHTYKPISLRNDSMHLMETTIYSTQLSKHLLANPILFTITSQHKIQLSTLILFLIFYHLVLYNHVTILQNILHSLPVVRETTQIKQLPMIQPTYNRQRSYYIVEVRVYFLLLLARSIRLIG